MRQLLMLGFYCEVYRREPLCRVYVNDMLADEFNIPHTPCKDMWESHQLDPAFWSNHQFELQSNSIFSKYIELDDAGDRSLNLRVEIHNDDNNCVNGFMTKYTRVKLRQCWLVPVKVWENFGRIWDRWKHSIYNWHKWHGQGKSVAYYYVGLRNHAIANLATGMDMCFPDINKEIPSNNYSTHWIGSSGHFHLTLAKKLGFWRHSTDRRIGWCKLSMINDVKVMYDKYKQYEDQRSSNT